MPEGMGLTRDLRVTSPTLRELAATLFRQSRIVVAGFLLVFLVVLLYAWFSPRYEAHLKVLLRRGRSDPIVSSQPPSPLDFARSEISEEELNSEVELLNDESLLKQVVKVAGLVHVGESDADLPADVERAVRKLAQGLKVDPARKSNLIQIRYRCADPGQAARVLSALSDAYVQKHLELRRPSGELSFFQQQTEDYARRLHQSEERLVSFTTTSGVSLAAFERDIALQRLGEAEAGYRQISQDRTETGRRISALREQLASFPSRSVTQKHWTDNPQLFEKLKSRLLELQLKRTELLTRFEPSYRLVQEVDRQIEETRQSITAEVLSPVRDETTDKDPNYEWARMELERAQVLSESLQGRESAASLQIAELRRLAQQRQSESVAQQDLIRTAKAEEESYLLYFRKREEARIGDALDQRRILNVAVVEPPVVPALPIHSSLFYFLAAFGLSLVFSVVMAFTAEYFDPTIRTPSEAKDLLGAPVLAWLPQSSAETIHTHRLRIFRGKVGRP